MLNRLLQRWSLRHIAWGGAGLVLGMWALIGQPLACGPFFPNTLLDGGDAAVMTAPEARFGQELERMKLLSSAFRARPATNAPRMTIEAELSDLESALDRARVPRPTRETIVQQHRLERLKILTFALSAQNPTAVSGVIPNDEFLILRPNPANLVRISGPPPQVTTGLPGEFADYLRGSVAWHQGKLKEARRAWNALLERPSEERQFKSVWAAFMLGKSWEEENRGKACRCFRLTRELAAQGFTDSLGLASSSLGWEARCHLRDHHFDQAIDLYLEQAAGGDPTAAVSLRWTAAAALIQPPKVLYALASQPRPRRVITAYVISGGFRDGPIDVDGAVKEEMLNLLEKTRTHTRWVPAPQPTWHRYEEPVLRWLRALEEAKVTDVESAEQIALAAYQSGQIDMAQRWLGLNRSTPLARWLRAKLCLRSGQTLEAAALLAQLCRQFPVVSGATNQPGRLSLIDSLYVAGGEGHVFSAAQQLQGELGVLRLARRQYIEALDALLQSGYWMDAAYVAERVLTLDELKVYVDRHWPEETETSRPGETEEEWIFRYYQPAYDQRGVGEKLRYLLARRLARAERWVDAREYYPKEWLPFFERFYAAWREAHQLEWPRDRRARAYFEAAQLARHYGLELVGTEVEPDWQIHGGSYEEGITVASRADLRSSHVAPADEELNRARQQAPSPELRYHYRYTAAALAWEAARLLPNNDEETARILGLAGTWLMNRDPQAADVFYKALVRRCRQTPLGAEADRRRWFPPLDADGYRLPTEAPNEPPGR